MIKIFDPQEQYNQIKDKLDVSLETIFQNGNFILGEEVSVLENSLCEYTLVDGCVCVGNGTDALEIALKALGVEAGDKVIVPSFTWVSSVEAIISIGAVPVYIDVDLEDFNFSLEELKSVNGDEFKAFVAVSIFGNAKKISQAYEICKSKNILMLEDGAQSFGAKSNKQLSCSIADISTTSFFPSKPLGCFGDGGAIFSNHQELIDVSRQISRHGQIKRYEYVRVGRNSRLDTLQAAVLLAKLEIFENEITLRNNIANKYQQNLCNIDALNLPAINELDSRSVWAQYTLTLLDPGKRESFIQHMFDLGIQTAMYYPVPIHSLDLYKSYSISSLKNTDYLSSRVVSIPMHPYLTDDEINHIIFAIKSFF